MRSLLIDDVDTIAMTNTKADLPPHSSEAEYGLLGWIILKNELLDHLLFLSPEHFYVPEHGEIFLRMIEMRLEGQILTPLSVAGNDRSWDGKAKYLAKAVQFSNIMIDPLMEARMIVELAERRAIIAACEKQIAEIKKSTRTTSEHIVDLQNDLEKVMTQGTTTKFISDVEVTKNILNDLQHPRTPFSTGLSRLDECMEGGIYPGKCYVLAGRKKMGKTTLAGTISCNMNQRRVKHLYIACEMGIKQIQQRNLSRLTDTFSNNFRTKIGQTDVFQRKIQQAAEESPGCTIYLNAPGITFENLRRAVAQAISLYKIKGFYVDCLQLVAGKEPRQSQVEHQDTVSQWIADYSAQHGVFSVVTAQMNQLGNIRFGEGIRMACDMAFEVKAPEDDATRSDRYLQMIETRYTEWADCGSKESPALLMERNGPYFSQFGDDALPPMDFGAG